MNEKIYDFPLSQKYIDYINTTKNVDVEFLDWGSVLHDLQLLWI